MTRTQVARRLGKSLATVRRIEGVLLHPTRDMRGVHHFACSEVEELAHDIGAGYVELAREMRPAATALATRKGSHAACTECNRLRASLRSLAVELDVTRSNHRDALAALSAQHAAELAEQTAELREMGAHFNELVDMLEG